MTSPTRCRSRSWGWILTPDQNSSTSTLLQCCERHQITFTRARPGNKNDGCHVEQKNWAVVRTVVGYHRYDTGAELLLLNEIWQLQSKLTNYFYPQQKLISKIRHGATVSKKQALLHEPGSGETGRHASGSEMS